MKTENQAKRTVCWRTIGPGADFCAHAVSHGIGETITPPTVSFCLGSECMAWDWGEPFLQGRDGATYTHDRKADSKTGPLTMIQVGYCGAKASGT